MNLNNMLTVSLPAGGEDGNKERDKELFKKFHNICY